MANIKAFTNKIKSNLEGVGEITINKVVTHQNNVKSRNNLDRAARQYALKGTNLNTNDMAKNNYTGLAGKVEAKRKAKRAEYKGRFGL
jgi:hypothetical protein